VYEANKFSKIVICVTHYVSRPHHSGRQHNLENRESSFPAVFLNNSFLFTVTPLAPALYNCLIQASDQQQADHELSPEIVQRELQFDWRSQCGAD
jgi:hypothetical protein